MKRTVPFTCILFTFLLSFLMSGGALLLKTVPAQETAVQAKIVSRTVKQDNSLLHKYRIKEENGVVCVYEGDTLLYQTNIPVSCLPQKDRDALKNGIFVNSVEEIHHFLEDFGA